MHADHHHIYESPKQYYSIQLSHTFCNDNIVLTCTKITTVISLKKNYRFSYVIGQANGGDFSCHLFHTKRTHWAKPATSNSVVAACGATVLVSRRPYKFHPGAFMYLTCDSYNHGSQVVMLLVTYGLKGYAVL